MGTNWSAVTAVPQLTTVRGSGRSEGRGEWMMGCQRGREVIGCDGEGRQTVGRGVAGKESSTGQR